MKDYPTLLAFNNALLHPDRAFTDPVLRQAEIVNMRMGLPAPSVGGFAATYRLRVRKGGSVDYAVRCFHRDPNGIESRYQTIATFLGRLQSPHFVRVEYQPLGIRVEKRTLPILLMEWIDAPVLGSVLRDHAADREALTAILRQLFALERSMRDHGMAHGDLHPDNLLWDGSTLRVIDYDGMFVPGMKPGAGAEKGLRHFQHPGRDAATHGPLMDRFSLIVLALSLQALILDPSLHQRFAITDENLIFTEDDYRTPRASEAFAVLAAMPALAPAVEVFARVCEGPVWAVPSLDEFRRGMHATANAVVPPRAVPATPRGARYVFHTQEKGFHLAVGHEWLDAPSVVIGHVASSRRLKNCHRLTMEDDRGTQAVVFLHDAACDWHAQQQLKHDTVVAVMARVEEVRRPKGTTGSTGYEVHFRIENPAQIRYLTVQQAEQLIRVHGDASSPSRQQPEADARPPPAGGSAPVLPIPTAVSPSTQSTPSTPSPSAAAGPAAPRPWRSWVAPAVRLTLGTVLLLSIGSAIWHAAVAIADLFGAG